ncbi:MAG: hypothetical protein E7214_06390 [Clostridium sp.]|nr:hypothetical protein [Clostridium sp.]
MSIKKFISFLVPIAIIIAICLSTNLSFLSKSYTGFIIDTKNKKILKTYPIKISGTYTKNTENKFNGYLFLDGERYYLTGDNSLNGDKELLTFNTHNKINSNYNFNSYKDFNKNDDIEIHSEDPSSSTLTIASNDTLEEDILSKIK